MSYNSEILTMMPAENGGASLFTYGTQDDVTVPGYFNAAAEIIDVNDLIYAPSPELSDWILYTVVSIEAGVVTIAKLSDVIGGNQ